MTARERFVNAERRLFANYGLECESGLLRLADPAVSIGVRAFGDGEPVLFIHGSGMSEATWGPVISHLDRCRSIVIDLPGFGLSDAYSYAGRPLRRHATAQLTSALDAIGLDRAVLVGSSLGAMWALCLAADAPERVRAVVSIGMPAFALPGLRGDPFFTLLTIPGLGRHVDPPQPRTALRPRAPGKQPVRFIWGQDDAYGGPQIGQRATELIPLARLDVMSGNHAPFLDHPERCAAVIMDAVAGAQAA